MILGIVCALLVTAGGSLLIGLATSRSLRGLDDVLPLTRGRKAEVRSAGEFSASTTATTVSLATVIIAYFELAPYLGPWLFWTVVTTGIGIALVRLMAWRIWNRLSKYGNHIPSLHEFLGVEFSSPNLRFIAGVCTSLGFLGAIAVELTVGSRFLSQFIPGLPHLVLVVALSAVGLVYTALGGFRAVIVTDRVQMAAIWVFAAVMSAVCAWYFIGHSQTSWQAASNALTDFSPREGLAAFVIGILVINVPTFVADMSMWQRLGGTARREDVGSGLWQSVIGAVVIWGILSTLAIVAPFAGAVKDAPNALVGFLRGLAEWLPEPAVLLVSFLIGAGLLSAMFSTASTQLIAFVHAAHEDVMRRWVPFHEKLGAGSARIVLILAGCVAIAIVEALNSLGLSVADLVFAVYGSQLGLVPAVFLGLSWERGRLVNMSSWAMGGVILGFVSGWACAIIGRVIGNSNVTFLAPVASLIVSSIVLLVGAAWTRASHTESG